MSILEQIIKHKQQEVSYQKSKRGAHKLKDSIEPFDGRKRFTKALRCKPISIIAEYKRKSPSFGLFPLQAIEEKLQKYINGGADAFSILTDEHYFGGSLQDITIARQFNKPILRKDFIVDEWQIYESKTVSVDCILLIAMALSPQQLIEYHHLASELEMAVIVEIHHESELSHITKNMEIIGVNNRNLARMSTDMSTSSTIINSLDKDKITICESGIKTSEDVKHAVDLGFDACLIGQSLLLSEHEQTMLQSMKEI